MMGIVVVASLTARVTVGPADSMTSTLSRTSSLANEGSRPTFPSGGAPLEEDAVPLDVSKLAQPLAQGIKPGSIGGQRRTNQKSYLWDFLSRLRSYLNPTEGECECDSEDSPPFWIRDPSTNLGTGFRSFDWAQDRL
jgi:hypothetical protein